MSKKTTTRKTATPRRKAPKLDSLPTSTKMLYRYLVPEDAIGVGWFQRLAKADVAAQHAMLADSDLDQISKVAEKLVHDTTYDNDTRRFLTEFFRGGSERVTTPEQAADELTDLLGFYHREAGFLLGFTLALRLSAAAGGAR